jgi:ABC-type bacteriocin/lantibiotic exporter with double-glycine peptidase domain
MNNSNPKDIFRLRQEALLRVFRTQTNGIQSTDVVDPIVGEPFLSCLQYSMIRLGGYRRRLLRVEGDFADILDANNIVYRNVRTPSNLMNTTRTLMLAFDNNDHRPLVIHRQLGRTLLYDPTNSETPKRLPHYISLKPFAFEIYPSWPLDLRSPFDLLSFSLHSHVYTVLAVLLSALVVALFNLSIPIITSYLVGTILPAGQIQLLAETALVVVLIVISTVTAQFFSSISQVRMESLLNLRLEAALWNHLLRLPLEFFSRFGSADLVTRVGSIGEMRKLISNGLLGSALALLFSVGNLGLMIRYQPQLSLVALVFSLVIVSLMINLVLRDAKFEKPLQDGISEISDLGLQNITGMSQVRVGGGEPFIFERWFRDFSRLVSLQRRSERSTNTLEILARVLNPIGQTLVIVTFLMLLSSAKIEAAEAIKNGTAPPSGGLATLSNTQLVALFVPFQAAYLSFNSQLSSMASVVANTAAKLYILWDRSKVVMYASPEGATSDSVKQHTLKGNFFIQNLELTYPGGHSPVLRDIDLDIPAGSYTAITGPSGCGKSTLLRALLRLMEYQAGVISADGVDISDLTIRPYRRQFGVVMQNTPLPAGTIYEIVRSGRSFDRDAVWESLSLAGIADDVHAMGMKLETVITQGAGAVSGGQRQRLALARALLGQPRVLLLDEATSALDARTQAVITRTLETLPITRIAVAHRLSTIESANQIAVIRDGYVRELGTYEELSSTIGGYLQSIHGH